METFHNRRKEFDNIYLSKDRLHTSEMYPIVRQFFGEETFGREKKIEDWIRKEGWPATLEQAKQSAEHDSYFRAQLKEHGPAWVLTDSSFCIISIEDNEFRIRRDVDGVGAPYWARLAYVIKPDPKDLERTAIIEVLRTDRELGNNLRAAEETLSKEGKDYIKPGLAEKWDIYVRANVDDFWSLTEVDSVFRVMKSLSESKTPEDAIRPINDELNKCYAGYEDQQACIAGAVTYFHPRGSEFKEWWISEGRRIIWPFVVAIDKEGNVT